MEGTNGIRSSMKTIACVAIATFFFAFLAAGQAWAEKEETQQSQSQAQTSQKINQAKQKAMKYSQKFCQIL